MVTPWAGGRLAVDRRTLESAGSHDQAQDHGCRQEQKPSRLVAKHHHWNPSTGMFGILKNTCPQAICRLAAALLSSLFRT